MSQSAKEALERIRSLGGAAARAASAHGFALRCLAAGGLSLVAAVSLGAHSLDRAQELEARAARMERLGAGLGRWEAAGALADPADSLAWAASRRQVEALGTTGEDPLVLARLVARRAEEVGVAGLRVRLATADSAGSSFASNVGAWSIEAGGTALLIDFEGSLGDVVSLLGSLPPELAAADLTAVPAGEVGRLRVHARLLARRIRQP